MYMGSDACRLLYGITMTVMETHAGQVAGWGSFGKCSKHRNRPIRVFAVFPAVALPSMTVIFAYVGSLPGRLFK